MIRKGRTTNCTEIGIVRLNLFGRVIEISAICRAPIRKATSADLEHILGLFAETIKITCTADYNPDQIEAWTSAVENKTKWLEKIENQYFLLFIEDEQLMGFGSLNDGNYIDLLYTHANAQRKGIGSQIYQELEVETRARQKNQTNCMLYADVSLTALPFFGNMGFDVSQENKVIIKGVQLINYRMKKNLEKIECL